MAKQIRATVAKCRPIPLRYELSGTRPAKSVLKRRGVPPQTVPAEMREKFCGYVTTATGNAIALCCDFVRT